MALISSSVATQLEVFEHTGKVSHTNLLGWIDYFVDADPNGTHCLHFIISLVCSLLSIPSCAGSTVLSLHMVKLEVAKPTPCWFAMISSQLLKRSQLMIDEWSCKWLPMDHRVVDLMVWQLKKKSKP